MSRSFSLVEIAVATLVLTVALLSLLAALTQGADVRMSARDGETAAHLIRAELERYRALPMSQVMTTIGGASEGVQPSVTVDQPDLGERVYAVLCELERDGDALQEGIGACVVRNLERMGLMGQVLVDHLRARHPELPLRPELGEHGDPWDHLPPLSPGLLALVARHRRAA